jgi:AcrR family transcriptional regulator
MEAESVRRVGRPRSERARQAILAATMELASETEPQDLTMEAIARRAAVSKETLYRWWRSKSEVLLETLGDYGEQTIPVPNSGSLAVDLQTFMRATSKALDPPTQKLLRSLAAAAAADASFACQVRERFIGRRRAALAALLEQAVDRGDLTAERTATVLDLIFGSLWYRLIFGLGPLDRDWADGVTEAITGA